MCSVNNRIKWSDVGGEEPYGCLPFLIGWADNCFNKLHLIMSLETSGIRCSIQVRTQPIMGHHGPSWNIMGYL